MEDAIREVKEMQTLYEISMALSASLNLNESINKIFSILDSKMGMSRGTLTLLNKLTNEISIEIAHGLADEAKKRGKYMVGEGITGKVIEKGDPAVIPLIGKEPLFLNKTRSRGDIKRNDISFICVPIKIGNEIIGAISVDKLFANNIAPTEDVRLLAIIASMIAQAVKLKRLIEEEKEKLISENIKLKEELREKYNITNIIGNSSVMHNIYENIIQVAPSNTTVLIRGESGTGKELVAHAVHYNSPRAQKPFIKINCATIPENLIESELFGHEKGAFTGANEQKKGKFEAAHGGTIFLDEIGELSTQLQVKLLRILQEREFERVGGITSVKVNVRVIAATNRDLEKEISEHRFREDLYYRLNVFPIYMPPLRERKTDVLLLAEYFLARYAEENDRKINRISTLAIDLLSSYHWPGNVRELQNCMERAVLLCNSDTIQAPHLPPTLQRIDTVENRDTLSLSQQVENFEKELIIDALQKSRGNKIKATAYLSTTERILGYKIERYEIDFKKFKR